MKTNTGDMGENKKAISMIECPRVKLMQKHYNEEMMRPFNPPIETNAKVEGLDFDTRQLEKSRYIAGIDPYKENSVDDLIQVFSMSPHEIIEKFEGTLNESQKNKILSYNKVQSSDTFKEDCKELEKHYDLTVFLKETDYPIDPEAAEEYTWSIMGRKPVGFVAIAKEHARRLMTKWLKL